MKLKLIKPKIKKNVRIVSVHHYNLIKNEIKYVVPPLSFAIVASLTPEDVATKKERKVELLFPGLPPLSGRKRIKCWKLWRAMYITVDGWITPCDHIPDKDRINHGNILKQDFKDIWNNDLYQYSRRRLRDDVPDLPCKMCI